MAGVRGIHWKRIAAVVLVALALHAAAEAQIVRKRDRSIRIVDAERGEWFGSISAESKGSVVLVLTVRGFSDSDWNRLPLSAFWVSSGGERFPCRLRTAMDLRPGESGIVPSPHVGEPRVAFVVPRNATSFTLQFLDLPPIAFTATSKVMTDVR